MKKLIFILLIVAVVLGLYFSNIFSFYAAEIDLKDIDVAVVYHYDDFDKENEFVGLHNRSKVHRQEGNFSLDPFYDQTLQIIADQDEGISYSIFFDEDEIQSSTEADLFEVCVYEKDFWRMKKKGSKFLTDTIYFEFDSDLEVSTKWSVLASRKPNYIGRSFRVKGEFSMSGIYNEAFIDFYIRRLILFKLKNSTNSYLLDYHGYRGWSFFYMRVVNMWSYRLHQYLGFNV